MGKSSRRPTAGTGDTATDPPVPVVGMRQPCPCGSGKRYKACHGRAARIGAAALVTRPFEGLAGECDWVALREIVPSATARVRTSAVHGGRDVTIATVLPLAWPALHRADDTVLVGLQTQVGSGDAGRDVAHALLAALAAPAGSSITDGVAPFGSPSLADVLDPTLPFAVEVHEGFDFWLGEGTEVTAEVRSSMEAANEAVVPTRRLTSVEAAYWCEVGAKRHLRWVMPHAEDALLDALARLHAAGELTLMDGARYVGAFRADGLVVPVWDLPGDADADDVEKPAAQLADRLAVALTVTTPLTAAERGARAGVVSRQLTLR